MTSSLGIVQPKKDHITPTKKTVPVTENKSKSTPSLGKNHLKVKQPSPTKKSILSRSETLGKHLKVNQPSPTRKSILSKSETLGNNLSTSKGVQSIPKGSKLGSSLDKKLTPSTGSVAKSVSKPKQIIVAKGSKSPPPSAAVLNEGALKKTPSTPPKGSKVSSASQVKKPK